MDDYTKNLIKYLNNKKYNFILQNYTHKLYSKSEICGDENIIYLNVDNKTNTIKDISYHYSSCSLNVVGLEILCEYLKGKNLNEIKKINENFFEKRFNFPKRKIHCINLIVDALKSKSLN